MNKILAVLSALVLLVGFSGFSQARPVSHVPQQRIVSDDTPFTTVQEPAARYSGPDFLTAAGAETIWYGGTQIVAGCPQEHRVRSPVRRLRIGLVRMGSSGERVRAAGRGLSGAPSAGDYSSRLRAGGGAVSDGGASGRH